MRTMPPCAWGRMGDTIVCGYGRPVHTDGSLDGNQPVSIMRSVAWSLVSRPVAGGMQDGATITFVGPVWNQFPPTAYAAESVWYAAAVEMLQKEPCSQEVVIDCLGVQRTHTMPRRGLRAQQALRRAAHGSPDTLDGATAL